LVTYQNFKIDIYLNYIQKISSYFTEKSPWPF